jgi:epoxyqueuosine reductase
MKQNLNWGFCNNYKLKDLKKRSKLIRSEALRLGFLDCGITSAEPPDHAAEHLSDWIRKGYHGQMKYMEENSDLRADPRKLLKGARSVIMMLQNYYTSGKQDDPSAPVIAMYAFGRDYHAVIKKKLKKILEYTVAEIQPCRGRIFVDSAPLSEKALAQRAGLGWTGKNSLLLSRKSGSFFFLGGIITDLELEYNDIPGKDYCGKCKLCIEACPTGAIARPGILDARKCISYLTIENRTSGLPAELKGNFRNRVFGCDICQDVCPWNKSKARPHDEPGLRPNPSLLGMSRSDWYALDEKKFDKLFKGTPVNRLKYHGLRRNLEFLQ